MHHVSTALGENYRRFQLAPAYVAMEGFDDEPPLTDQLFLYTSESL